MNRLVRMMVLIFTETDFIEAALLRPGEYIQLEITEEGIDALY
jgi:hypothetical protein